MQTRFKTLLMPLAMAATLAAFAGCRSTSDRTAGRVLDDNTVNNKVEDALKHATVYKFDDVKVTTHNGIVQLNGWATTEEQVTKAGEIASRVDGVSRVINNIALKLTPTGRDSGYPDRAVTNNAPAKVDAPVKTPTTEPAPIDQNRNTIPRDPATDPNRTTTDPIR